MCLYPTMRINKKYTSNKKNAGIIPEMDDPRVKYVATACGNCIECRKQYARSWQVRLLEDIKQNKNGKFVTLTFSNESICSLSNSIKNLEGYELDNEIAIRAVKLFRERWRKKYGKSLRHFLITELGHNGTENIHLHGIVWTSEKIEEVAKIWSYGYVWPPKEQEKNNYVNEATINYITKYITKIDEKHKYYKAVTLTSPGMGAAYITTHNAIHNKFNNEKTNEAYKTRNGYKISLPIYWRNKLYTEKEREKLWINKLDKEERWICGVRISIKQGDTEYYNVLNHYRELNKQLGYRDNEKNWSREQYERERRIIMQQTRIKNANKKIQQTS